MPLHLLRIVGGARWLGWESRLPERTRITSALLTLLTLQEASLQLERISQVNGTVKRARLKGTQLILSELPRLTAQLDLPVPSRHCARCNQHCAFNNRAD